MFRALLLALAAAVAPTPAQKLGLPPVAAGPVPGYVMIADRNNNRIILVSPAKKVIWRIEGLHDPDDAFFSPGYKAISTNEEYNQTMALIGTRSPVPLTDPAVVALGGRIVIVGGGTNGVYAFTPR